MHEQEEVLLDALNKDLGKTKPEAYMTEIMLVKNAVSDAIYNLKEWMRYPEMIYLLCMYIVIVANQTRYLSIIVLKMQIWDDLLSWWT